MSKEKEVTREDISNKLREIGERQINEILKSQREEIVEEIEKIRSNTIGCGDVLDEIINLITKEE